MRSSSGRVVVMGGLLKGAFSLPLSVVHHLDFDFSGSNQPTWSTTVSLRVANSSSGNHNRSPVGENVFPICRIWHTMTIVTDTDMAFLIGGIKMSARDTSNICRTIFSFDTHGLNWKAIDGNCPRWHRPPDWTISQRFGHTEQYISSIRQTK